MASGGSRAAVVRGRVFLLPILLAAVVGWAAAGVWLGLWIHRQGVEAIDRAPGRYVVAVVHPGSAALPGSEGSALPDTRHISWTAPDGGVEEADVQLRSDPSSPDRTRIRVGARGQLRPSSPDQVDVLSTSLITTVAWELVAVLAGVAVYRRFGRRLAG